jgi:general stress protein 26
MSDLKQRIHALAKELQLIHVATADAAGTPHVRPVVGKADDDLAIRFSTHLDSNKIHQIRNNPNVHLTMGAADVRSQSWLQIEGVASISTAEKERRAFWFDGLRAYISGIDDPRYCVVIIEPRKIELHSMQNSAPEVWTPLPS